MIANLLSRCNYWVLFFAAVTVVPPIGSSLILYTTQEAVTFTVKKTERITSSSGESSKYMVFTEKETFENTDAFVFLKFNSSDIYGSIEVDHTYEAKVAGWRSPFLSWHRNIIQVQKKN